MLGWNYGSEPDNAEDAGDMVGEKEKMNVL